MSAKFDPYHKWLGIPSKDQPPHHYRLLSIECFEPDLEVIDAAANRVMGYLQNLSAGEHAEASQRLLNELAAARLCLLNTTKKAEYDEALRESLAQRAPSSNQTPSKPTPPLPPRSVAHRQASSTTTAVPVQQVLPEQRKARKRRNNQILVLVLSIVFVLLLGAAYHVLTRDGRSSKGRSSKDRQAADLDQQDLSGGKTFKKKKPKRPVKQMPPLSEFDPNKPVESVEDPSIELSPDMRQAFAELMEQAEAAIRKNRPADAKEILDRYLSFGDAPAKQQAMQLREECLYADIDEQEAGYFLDDMPQDELLALQRGALTIRIEGFRFTRANLEEEFHNRLRRFAAAMKQPPGEF